VKTARRDLVLLHGWAMSPRVWAPVLEALSAEFRIHNLALPGYEGTPDGACHGPAAGGGEILAHETLAHETLAHETLAHETLAHETLAHETLAQWAAACQARAPAGALWMGWSLGAMVALQAALDPAARIAGLILVSATPRFTRGGGWRHGLDRGALRGFLDGLRTGDRRLLKRFLLLQAGESDDARDLSRRLAEGAAGPGASIRALEAGLAVLEQVDLRSGLGELPVPVRVIHGAEDRIVPLAAGEHLARTVPNGALTRLDTGHAPFAARPRAFSEAVLAWT